MPANRKELLGHIDRFNEIIAAIESRCMACDGPVTPTLKEMQEAELSDLWQQLQAIRNGLKWERANAG